MSLEDIIPGYKEALACEREKRDAAFLGAVEPIAGVAVAPLTLARLNLLILSGNAFAIGGPISPAHAAHFLWIAREGFTPGDPTGKLQFFRRVARLPVIDVYEGISRCLRDAFFDLDEAAPAGSRPAPIASWVACLVDRIASEYGWSRREIMDTPIVELSQYLRCIERRHGGTLLNPTSDGVKFAWLESINNPPPAPAPTSTDG